MNAPRYYAPEVVEAVVRGLSVPIVDQLPSTVEEARASAVLDAVTEAGWVMVDRSELPPLDADVAIVPEDLAPLRELSYEELPDLPMWTIVLVGSATSGWDVAMRSPRDENDAYHPDAPQWIYNGGGGLGDDDALRYRGERILLVWRPGDRMDSYRAGYEAGTIHGLRIAAKKIRDFPAAERLVLRKLTARITRDQRPPKDSAPRGANDTVGSAV